MRQRFVDIAIMRHGEATGGKISKHIGIISKGNPLESARSEPAVSWVHNNESDMRANNTTGSIRVFSRRKLAFLNVITEYSTSKPNATLLMP